MKKFRRKLIVLSGVMACTMLLFVSNNIEVCAAEDVATTDESGNRATNLEWFYKEINGEMYMRLYNHTTGEWLTDWIPAV